MKILVINCGSSTVKYKVFQLSEGEELEGLASGVLDRIGAEWSTLTHCSRGKTYRFKLKAADHREGLRAILKNLTDPEHGVIKDPSEVYAIGHRVVHGGDSFFQPTLITKEVMEAIQRWCDMAPLHNPANLAGIEAAISLIPKAYQVAVFDTAFHQTMPQEAYLYAIPYEYYERYRVRRYGFHGISHKYVAHKAAEIMGVSLSRLKMVTCHLGSGCSVAAVKWGKCVDTSMGFTPLEGLVMSTRCGDIDPSLVFFLAKKERLSLERLEAVLNRRSGLLGLSGISGDVRDLWGEVDRGNRRAKIAMRVFAYRVRKYIGAYAAAMGGLDAIVFTAGIGENDWRSRELICDGLEFLGVELDRELNRMSLKEPRIISRGDSRVKVLVVPTNEELAIAVETVSLLKFKRII